MSKKNGKKKTKKDVAIKATVGGVSGHGQRDGKKK